MLLTKPLEKHDVVTIKLMNGEEILGRFETEDDSSLVVSRASVVAAGADDQMGLVPWLMSASPEKVSINKTTIVAYLPTVKEIADVFTKATSSIQIVK
ncbi:hypothetical protein N9C44_00485 [bacterium]|jgi:hypothetical protein|nr:hypothetical protein [bacterium]|tara:strand:- start:162 stop:455 length:294 start_codon:yes stop_codon:yes gene_type:complete